VERCASTDVVSASWIAATARVDASRVANLCRWTFNRHVHLCPSNTHHPRAPRYHPGVAEHPQAAGEMSRGRVRASDGHLRRRDERGWAALAGCCGSRLRLRCQTSSTPSHSRRVFRCTQMDTYMRPETARERRQNYGRELLAQIKGREQVKATTMASTIIKERSMSATHSMSGLTRGIGERKPWM
jgi:hypothetical protein